MLHHKLSANWDSYDFPWRYTWQSDGLRTGKEGNGNIPVIGGLTAKFDVARFWFTNNSTGAAAIQLDYASGLICAYRNSGAIFSCLGIPIPDRQPQHLISIIRHVASDFMLFLLG